MERWILAVLRHERLVGWDPARARVRALLDRLNARAFQKLPGSRLSLGQEERPALAALPTVPYEYAEWRTATVHRDYHIDVNHFYYSVPYRLVGERVEVRITATMVECFHDHLRVASHPRLTRDRWHTLPEHMPPAHRAVTQGWDAAFFRQKAGQVGPHTAELIDTILTRAVIPQQVFRRCQGILALASQYSGAILETAAQRALTCDAFAYRVLKAFCEEAQKPAARKAGPSHANVRGPGYYAPSTPPEPRSAP